MILRVILRPDIKNLEKLDLHLTHGKKYFVYHETLAHYCIKDDKNERIWLNKVYTRLVPSLTEIIYKKLFKKG